VTFACDASPLLRVDALCKSFGGVVATDQVSIDVFPGEMHAVIGPNGAGKTTLVAQLSGMLSSDAGRTYFDGVDISALSAAKRAARGLARSFQITSILPDFSVLQNVALAVQARSGSSFRFWRPAHSESTITAQALDFLDGVGLSQRADETAGNLAHGEQRQLEIAMALALAPKMLLLDEPMAGMGSAESELMIGYLRGLKGRYGVLLIEHDMDAVFALADRISVLVYGRIIARGTPAEIRSDAAVREAYLGTGDA
jgi:branched-chain amino acid transport system ATP-binding protein